jgi:hypothetical protein
MRYLPSGDACEEGLYDEPLESESDGNALYGGSLYPTSGQHLESDNVGEAFEQNVRANDFSASDATCIPTDSTYIDYSERSADENLHRRHGYDSSADMVDSTVSDLSETERPERSGAKARQGETKRGGELLKKLSKKLARDESCKHGGHSQDNSEHSVQDETVSGHEGDDDASEDEEEYAEVPRGTSGILVDNRSEAMDTQGSEVDSSEDVEVRIDSVIVGDYTGNVMDNDDSTDMDTAGHGTVLTDQFDDVEGEPGTSLDTMKTEGHTGESKDNTALHATDGLGQLAIVRDNVDKISNRKEDIHSPREVSTSDSSDRTSDEASNEKNEKEATTREAFETGNEAFETGNEVGTDKTGDLDSGTDDNELDDDEALSEDNTASAGSRQHASQNTKLVSSTSDTGSQKTQSLQDGNFCEANQSLESQQDVCQSSARNESLTDVRDCVGSSTDRGNSHRGDPEDVVDDVDVSALASGKSSEGNVTSSNEHVEGADENKEYQDKDMDQDEHVISEDEHVTSEDEHVTSEDEHVTSEDEHVVITQDHVDNKVTEERSQAKERNEVGGVETTEDPSGLGAGDMSIETTGDRDTMVTSVEDTTLRDLQEHGGDEVQREDIEREYEGSIWDETVESTSNTGYENASREKDKLLSEAASSNQNVSTTDENVDGRSSTDGVMTASHQQTQEEENVENINDITSTVEETNIASRAHISSTFDEDQGKHERSFAEADNGSESSLSLVTTRNSVAKDGGDVASSSSVAMRRYDVATSSVAMQRDDVRDAPNISDVSSSDTSENAENANEPESHMDFADSAESLNPVKSRTDSSEVNIPDSAENANEALSRIITNLSRRSSEDSNEPSTTNLDERAVSDSLADNHENISENEAESLTNYEESEFRTVRDTGVHVVNNIVDSSTVSPVSFTDDTSHVEDVTGYLGSSRDFTTSTADNIVDTTEYLGLNSDSSASDNNVQSTGYFGNNSGSLGTPEGTVGTTVGITSSTKYDITVEAISSDEEELEEGEIAETPDDVTRNDVTPCDVSPEHVITSSSGSYYPPLDTIPISPPADSDEPSSSSFLEFGTYPYSSTQLPGSSTQPAGSSTHPAGSSTQLAGSSTQLAGSSRVTHSVFPFSALNVRSAPNSSCSSPVAVGFASGCNTPIRFQQADSTPIRFQPADSSNMLTPQYEPLSDDESNESHDTEERRHSSMRDTDSN